MSYVDSNLTSGEHVTYRAQLHAVIFLPGVLCLAIGTVTSMILVIIGVLLCVVAFARQASTEMAVTNKRVIMKTGLLSLKSVEMNLSKVETIMIDQGLFGQIFNYGTVKVVGSGGTGEPFKGVHSPMLFRRAMQEQTDGGAGPRMPDVRRTGTEPAPRPVPHSRQQ